MTVYTVGFRNLDGSWTHDRTPIERHQDAMYRYRQLLRYTARALYEDGEMAVYELRMEEPKERGRPERQVEVPDQFDDEITEGMSGAAVGGHGALE